MPAVTITARQLRSRVAEAENETIRLARIALHPRSRAVIVGATRDLDIAISRLQRQPDSLELENLVMWLESVERRLRLISSVIQAGGPSACPASMPHHDKVES